MFTVRSQSDDGMLTVRSSQITISLRYDQIRSHYSHGTITVRWRYAHGTMTSDHNMLTVRSNQIMVFSRYNHSQVTVCSRYDHSQITVCSRYAHGQLSQGNYSWPVFRCICSYQRSQSRHGALKGTHSGTIINSITAISLWS